MLKMDIEGMILGIFCLIFGIVVALIGIIMTFAAPAVAIFPIIIGGMFCYVGYNIVQESR